MTFLLSLLLTTSALALECPTSDADLGDTTGTFSSTTVNAGDDFAPTCAPGTGEDIAVEWTAPANGRYRMHTIGSGLEDTVLYVRSTGDCATELACNDDLGGGSIYSSVVVTLAAGQTVQVIVDAYEAIEPPGPVDLSIELVACGDGFLDLGEDCDDGNLIDGDGCESTCIDSPQVCGQDVDLGSATGNTVASGNTCGMFNDFGGASCALGQESEDAAFLWRAPRTGDFAISTFGSSYDSAITVQDLTCNELACDDDGAPFSLAGLEFAAVGGRSYLIVVDGYRLNSCGDFELHIQDQSVCPDLDLDGTCDMDLEITTPVPASPMTFSVTSAPPNTNLVFLVGGGTGAPTCHPVSTEICTTIVNPQVVGTATTNAGGAASLTLTVPAGLPSGLNVHAQAVWLQGTTGGISDLAISQVP